MKRALNSGATLAYRLISPIVDPLKLIYGTIGYFRFIKVLINFTRIYPGTVRLKNLYPITNENINYTPFDAHYFYQQLWAFEKILKSKVKRHHDVASTYQLSGYLSKVCKATFIDIRPIDSKLNNLDVVDGNLLHLPYKTNSIDSLSCLHVVEHIGLGRYDDYVDLQGSQKAALELQRVLSKGGKLYFSTPIGVPDIYFNAHRVFHPTEVLRLFPKLSLVSFSVVTDSKQFIENTNPSEFVTSKYACGMYEFTKK